MRKELHAALVNGVPEVQARVFPLIMPQDTKKNSIVYRVIAVSNITGLTCTTPIHSRYGFQIDIFAHTYAESVAILNKVQEVLRDKFLVFNPFTFEDYANITLKYKQILDVQIEGKYVPPATQPPVNNNGIVNHGFTIVNHGNSIINN
jgi:hypothetical protein